MPSRLARSSVQVAAPKNARNKNRKRNLDAYAIASHSLPTKPSVRQNRLGEFLDNEPKQKRRRIAQQDDEESDDDDEAPTLPRRPSGNNEAVEEGSDSEGNQWTLGGLRQDDEDSDLDSDEAFGESDEERFAGFTFRGSSSQRSRKPSERKQESRLDELEDEDIDLDEDDAQDEQEEEDDFGDEGVDLATMLDEKDEEILGEKDRTLQDIGDDGASVDDDEEEEGISASESDQEDEDHGAADQERLARIRDQIEALEPTTQQATKSAAAAPPTKLTLDDLMSVGLDTSFRKELAKERKKSKQTKVFTAPLPPRQQDRLNREVATQKAKEQLDRWRDTVIQNRRAEFLSFPLRDPERSEPIGKDKFIETAPQNELEENIRRIMEESGMVGPNADGDVENAILKSEGLAEKHVPLEEAVKRRAELRRARELLFREEIKAKRIAKIKSKSYRRVHRKERARKAEQEREMFGMNEPDEEAKEKAERKRAEARMSTKHRDSKWAKSLKATNRAIWDEGAKESVNEQARRNEELRRRIDGEEILEDTDGDLSSENEEDNEDVEHTLAQLDQVEDHGEDDRESRGLGAMKFMRAAEERRKKQNDEDIERLRRELAIEDGDEEDEAESIDDQGLGRAIFGPKGKEKPQPMKKDKRPELEEGDNSDDVGENDEEVDFVTDKAEKKRQSNDGTVDKPDGINKSQRVSRIAPGAGNATAESLWLLPSAKGNHLPANKTKDNADGQNRRTLGSNDSNLISTGAKGHGPTNSSLPVNHPKTDRLTDDSKVGSVPNTDGWSVIRHNDNEGTEEVDNGSETEPADPILTSRQQSSKYSRQAFAADDTKAAFDAEKAEAVASEDEKEVSNYMPGWGSWTGEGLSKSIRKANARQRHNPLFKRKLPGVKAQDRKDARLGNVMISEKQDRKGKRYKADILPHGYEKKEQYERALRVPMGPEWVTKETFQRNTKPRVVVKPGAVVAPMERPIV